MRLPRLTRRRTLWIPTFAGWVVACALVIASGGLLSTYAYPFLAMNSHGDARILVVEGWMNPPQLDGAAEAYRNGAYDWVLVTGGPVVHWPGDQLYPSVAHRAARYLGSRGVPDSVLIPVATGELLRHRTYYSALAVRARMQKEQALVPAIDVVSAGPHARRSRFLYALAFGPQTRVGIFAVPPADYDPAAWWRSSAGVQEVAGQLFALVWAKAFFWPEGRLPW